MARLPTVADLGTRPIMRPQRGIATVNDAAMQAPARAMASFGDAARSLGIEIQDREDTAAAKERDNYASEEIRKTLYDPESGFLNSRGRNAVDGRSAVNQRLEEIKAKAVDGLSPAAARKVKDTIDRRIASASQSVDIHTSGERTNWINGTAQARMAQAQQDSLADPGRTAEALRIIDGELQGMAAREGWSQEEYAINRAQRYSKVHSAQVAAMAPTDPQGALDHLEKNADDMLPGDVEKLRQSIEPIAAARRGRDRAIQEYTRSPVSGGYSVKIEYALGSGKKRPYRPRQPVIDVIGTGAESVLGQGARVVVFSGSEHDYHGSGKNKPQHGSNRHKTGNAADIHVYRPDGTRVLATDPEAKDLARAWAASGAKGIGFGMEYMGGVGFHVDLVTPGSGQANTWASGGKAMRSELSGIMRGAPATTGGAQIVPPDQMPAQPSAPSYVDTYLSIEDPREADEYLRTYEKVSGLRAQERRDRLSALSQEAFGHIESGGSMDDLPLDVRANLGLEAVRSLRNYEEARDKGEPIRTDPAQYLGLRRMAEDDPESFVNQDLVEFTDRLGLTELKELQGRQEKIRAGTDADKGMAASSIMSLVGRELRAVGINPTPNPDDEDDQAARIQYGLVQWQDRFIADNGRAPTQVEVLDQVRSELTPVIINPRGPLNQQESRAGIVDEVDLTAERLGKSSIQIGEHVFSRDEVQEAIAFIERSGADATPLMVTDFLRARLDLQGISY